MDAGEDPLAPLLPLRQLPLLRSAIGQTLIDIERWTASPPASSAEWGGEVRNHFAECSGPTVIRFSGDIVHSFEPYPGQLSLTVDGVPYEQVSYCELYRLSESTATAPAWLLACLGQVVQRVRVHVYRDDVPSPEARQAAVSYVLGSGVELFYAMHIHGGESSDMFIQADQVIKEYVASVVSASDAGEAKG